MKTDFDLTPEQRSQLLHYLEGELERYYHKTETFRVAPDLDPEKIMAAVRCFDLRRPVESRQALESVIGGMTAYAVHTPHPMYYGLYNPRPNFAGILADLITAVLNPQLAAWSHSPYASEVERYLVETFGQLFGYRADSVDGVFASGGAEANFTALLCALTHRFPGIGKAGLQGLPGIPVLYCSGETHHSVLKGARMAGLGSDAVRFIDVDRNMRMKVDQLAREIEQDLAENRVPVMVIATAGTTGTGVIDRLDRIGTLCREHGIWYHVDAAYGGAVAVNPDFRHWIKGIGRSDSLIVDLHKWFSVPMAASMFLTRHPEILRKTFAIETDYMPGDARNLEVTDAFTHSFQWSRRFTGLKIYLSLLMFGLEGYAEVIREHVRTGDILREQLAAQGWKVVNETPLPVVCFTDDKHGGDPHFARFICDTVVKSGEAWISVYPVGDRPVLRACITNYNTGHQHTGRLVELLDRARLSYGR